MFGRRLGQKNEIRDPEPIRSSDFQNKMAVFHKLQHDHTEFVSKNGIRHDPTISCIEMVMTPNS